MLMTEAISKVQSAEEACFSHRNTIQSQNECNRLYAEVPDKMLDTSKCLYFWLHMFCLSKDKKGGTLRYQLNEQYLLSE